MELNEIKSALDAQAVQWEAFKVSNEERIKSEAKGAADVLFEEKSKKLNDAMDATTERLKALELKAARPESGAGEVSGAAAEYKAAFAEYARTGNESGLQRIELKSFISNSGADGGFAIPAFVDAEINKKLIDISPIRAISQVVTSPHQNYSKMVDIGGVSSGWVSESATRPATNTPQLARVAPVIGELYANPQATQVMLNDAGFNMETWLSDEVQTEFARNEGAAFVSGDGVGKPLGFTSGTPVSTSDATRAFGVLQYTASGNASTMPTSADTFITLIHTLKAGYRQGAGFVCARSVLSALRSYKDTTNQYLWQPSMQMGTPDSFFGYPVTEAEDMPAVAAGTMSLAFGNFKAGYLIVDVTGTATLRDPYSNKPFIGFYTVKRVGGVVQNSEAIKLLKIATS